MATSVKWIKITTDIFDDEKIKLIDALPDRDAVLVIWIKLLTLAKKNNNNGRLMLTKTLPFSVSDLSIIFNRPLDVVKKSIKILFDLGEVQICDGVTIVYSKIIKTDRDRNTSWHKKWRSAVFCRDNFTCCMCGKRGGKLEAHHEKPWASFIEYRYDVCNGVTLCYECHKMIHGKGRCV